MMLSSRGMPRLSQILAGYGRRGDTMLAHINPQEAQLLKRRGGSGTTNPVTGLAEFFTSSKGDREHGGAFGGGSAGGSSGSGSGNGGKSGLGGGAVRGGRAYGGALGGGVRGRSSGMGSDPIGGKSAGVGKSLAGVIGGGPVSENALAGMTATGTPGFGIGWGDVLSGVGGAIGGAFGGPLGGMALGSLGKVLGNAIGDGEIGGTSVTDARDGMYGGKVSGGGLSSGGSLSRAEGPGSGTTATRRRGQRPDRPSPAPNTPALPEIPELPSWLGGIGQGMSPLQIRSFIATQGSQGLDSAYRDMATLDYYRKLLKSTVGNYSQILPVEHRYLQDVFGFQYQPTLQDLYRIIGG